VILVLALTLGIASADEMVTNLRTLASQATTSRVGFCSDENFGNARCDAFLNEVRGKADFQEIAPDATEPNAQGERFARLFHGCDLKGDNGRLAGGTKSDAIVRAEGYVLDDSDGIPYAWVAYYFVRSADACRPARYDFMNYGDLQRPSKEQHQDGIVLWQKRPFLLVVWQVASGPETLFEVGLNLIDRPDLGSRSHAVAVNLFTKSNYK